ncbi:MAG: hypothetical protein P8H96_14830, partial [Akkermansiaceae bacterium]|nr:hypothetical protein [Akkermansiaceae bacterium]
KYATDPTMWTATSFLLDRYLRYWLYHPPYTAGWTYGRRQGHFLAIGTPEEAQRKFETELKTLNGETVKIPESSDGKWTVISFVPTAAGNGYLKRYAAFVSARPFQDTKLIVAVLDDDAESADKLLKEKAAELEKRRQQPDTFPTLLVPGGLQNPIVRQLGMVTDEEKPKNNILMIRPDGSIAVAMSGLAMSAQKGSVIQNVIEFHDEELVDKALAKGDLDEAKRLAFAHAPVEQVRPEDAPRNWKPKVLTVPHLRSRAKVYLAMGELKAAQADIQEVYLKVNTAAGYISMRTKELEETEALKASILTALEKAE